MNTKQLEQNGYVATPDDIREITQESLSARSALVGTGMTYLRALVGTSQSQLGMPQAKRRTVPAPMTPEEVKRQLEVIEEVHERFYEAVMKVVSSVPLQDEERSIERRLVYASRANFARSAKATLRAWILSNNNLRGLVAAKVTKYALQAEIAKSGGSQDTRAPSEKRLVTQADRILKRIQMAGTPEDSIRLLEVVISRFVAGLSDLGVETTTKLEDALQNHKLFGTKTGVFFPVQVPEARTH